MAGELSHWEYYFVIIVRNTFNELHKGLIFRGTPDISQISSHITTTLQMRANGLECCYKKVAVRFMLLELARA